jgi:hypothetical protein
MENRRQHYRIMYPTSERPRFVFANAISAVIECSERGVRFRTAGEPPELGSRISGRMGMRHGQELRISGTVVWSDESIVALHLDKDPIPFLAMMREQLYLRQLKRQLG